MMIFPSHASLPQRIGRAAVLAAALLLTVPSPAQELIIADEEPQLLQLVPLDQESSMPYAESQPMPQPSNADSGMWFLSTYHSSTRTFHDTTNAPAIVIQVIRNCVRRSNLACRCAS